MVKLRLQEQTCFQKWKPLAHDNLDANQLPGHNFISFPSRVAF